MDGRGRRLNYHMVKLTNSSFHSIVTIVILFSLRGGCSMGGERGNLEARSSLLWPWPSKKHRRFFPESEQLTSAELTFTGVRTTCVTREVLRKKLGWDLRSASYNSHPIYDFLTRPKFRYPIDDRGSWLSCPKQNLWRAFVNSLILIKSGFFQTKNIPNSRFYCKKHTLLMTKLAKIDLFMIKGTEIPYPLPPHIPSTSYLAHI